MASSEGPAGGYRYTRRDFLRASGLVVAGGLTAPLLSACAPSDGGASSTSAAVGGSTSAPTASGDTFTFYTSTNHVYDTWANVIAGFEADHGVSVNWQKFNFGDMATKLQADFAANSVPDLVEQPGGYPVVSFATSGDALPLDDFIAADGEEMGFPSDWQDQAVESWRYQDSIYGIQLMLTCYLPFYNRQLFENAGISEFPSTWDDFLLAMQELTRDGTYGCAVNASHPEGWSWLLQNGVTYYDENSQDLLVPSEAAIEALQFQSDLIHRHEVAPLPATAGDQSGPRDLLASGQVATMMSGPWDIKPLSEGNPDLDLALALPLEGATRATAYAGAGLFIPTASEKPDLAWDLIKRLSSLETELALTAEANQTMPRKSWAASEQVQQNTLISSVADALAYGQDWNRTLAPTGKVAEVDSAFKTLYESVVLTAADPATELEVFKQTATQALQ